MRVQRPTGAEVAMAALAAAAAFFTLLSWDGLSNDASAFLVPLFWVAAGVGALGLGLRSVGAPRTVVPLVQLLVVGLALHRAWVPDGPAGGWLPTPASLEAIGELFGRAVEETTQYAAPMPGSATAFPALMLASGAVVVLLVDLLACTLRRVPLAGLPLLAVFTAPVSLVGGVSWLTFVLAGSSFVLLLAAEQAANMGQWGRSLAGAAVVDDQPHQVRLATLWPSATRMGLAGIGIAVVAPLLIPTGNGLLDGNDGIGTGDGGDEVEITNPMLNIRRDLTRGEDIPLVRVETDDPDPSYLRLTVLDEYDGSAWRPSDRDIPEANRVGGALPAPPGLALQTPRAEHRWAFQVEDEFDTTWLPLPYPATSVDVAGDWRFDDDTLDVTSLDQDVTAAGLEYDAVGVELRPTAESLVTARQPSGDLFIEGTRLPASLPPYLREMAGEVTDGAQSEFERAVMLQEWFRETGGFEYTTDRAEGNGIDTLKLFLGTGPGSRRGYCEQFAAAMAMMARSVGIPARVAVGFLSPDPAADGSGWVYSAHDLHAWPELYFEGAGWLRFEPTPQDRADGVPGYTAASIPVPDDVPTPTATPGQESPSAAPTQSAGDQEGTSSDEAAGTVRWWLAGTGVVVGLVALAWLPRTLRSMARRRRLSPVDPAGGAESGWAEVRATAIDLGLGWDDGATLRRRAQALVPLMAPTDRSSTGGAQGPQSGQPAPSTQSPVEALESLVLLVERGRFSRTGLPLEAHERVPALAESVSAALVHRAGSRAQRRATWLPASLWRSSPGVGRGVGQQTRPQPSELDRVSL